MMEIMNRLTDKSNWNEKVFNDRIVAKWTAEILRTPNQDVSENMIDWVTFSYYMRCLVFHVY